MREITRQQTGVGLWRAPWDKVLLPYLWVSLPAFASALHSVVELLGGQETIFPRKSTGDVTEYSAKKGGRLNGIKCKPQLEEKYYITQLGETCREDWLDSHQFHFLFLAHKRQHFPAPLQLGWDPVVGFCQ